MSRALTASDPRCRRAQLLATFLVVFGATHSAHAFRTAQELPKVNSSVPVRFEQPSFDFWLVRPSVPQDIADFQPQNVVVEAAEVWAQPACSSARAQLIGLGSDPAAPGDQVNTIQWVTDWEARGYDPQAAGYTDVQFVREEGSNWKIAEADIYLNANFRWSLEENASPPLRSVKAVLVHELGHAFGLLHPCEVDDEPRCSASDDASVTMYPIYSAGQATLADDDIAGICSLYPVPDCTVTGCAEGFVCSAGVCVASCGSVVCDAGSFCNGDLRCQVPSPCPGQTCIGRTCTKDAQCGVFEHCNLKSYCAQGTLLEGQTCSASSECERGVCANGFCRQRCASLGDCGENEACDAIDEMFSACVPHGAPTGDTCSSPLDCSGRQCLLNAKPSPICTQACGANYAECPIGWACASADGERVCAPIRPTGGCSFRPLTSDFAPELGGLLLALALGFARQRRRGTARALED